MPASKHTKSDARGHCRTHFAALLQVLCLDPLGSQISSGVWACVHTTNAGATAFNRHPVAIRSICLTAFWPSLPAHTSVA